MRSRKNGGELKMIYYHVLLSNSVEQLFFFFLSFIFYDLKAYELETEITQLKLVESKQNQSIKRLKIWIQEVKRKLLHYQVDVINLISGAVESLRLFLRLKKTNAKSD